MKGAVAYCRVSTDEQAQEGYSLDAQEKSCRDFAQKNSYNILTIYREEGKTATNLNRPKLREMIADCENNKAIEAVIVQETDRLSRNSEDYFAIRANFRKLGIRFIPINQPMIDDSAEGNLIGTIMSGVNQFFSDLNSRKTLNGLKEKFESGWYPGWAPHGYKNVPADKKNIIIPDQTKWDLIKDALKMYLSGNYSTIEIMEYLDSKGVKARNDKPLCYSVMNGILRNPFYAGIIRWGGLEKVGNHKPMITVNEHNRILALLHDRNNNKCRRRKYEFLLRGFVFCNICGQRYTAESHREGHSLDYYHCSARSLKHSNQGQNIKTDELEKLVEEEFQNIQFSQELINLVVKKINDYYQKKNEENKKIKRALLNKQLSIEQKKTKAENKLINGTLSDDDFTRINSRLKDELASLQCRLIEAGQKREVNIDIIQKVLLFSRNLYEAYKKAPYDLKRMYLSLFWNGFWVKDKKIVSSKPTDIIETLIKNKKVILSSKWGG